MFYLKNLSLTNFRCYTTFKMDFSPSINILVGNNAVGKTSLVEAVYCLAFTKSFKSSNDKDLINKNNSYGVLKGSFASNETNDEVLVSFSSEGKKIKKNNKPYSKISDYVGFFNVVVFCPEDLDIIKGSPQTRRKFLDVNLGQINKKYLNSLILYKKILKQRNELLKNYNIDRESDKRLLEIITTNLINEAKVIVEARKSFIKEINPYIIEKGSVISNGIEQIYVKYVPSSDVENIESSFYKAMSHDIALKTTTIGPHRDDLLITFNNMEASVYGSQGQQRTAALSIMLGLAELFMRISSKLIIILDDVFSELDNKRQNEILKLLNNSNQIFITTTSINDLSEDVIKSSNIIKITKEGELNE